MEGLRVYGRATSSNVQALLWGMEEMGLAFERIDCGEVYGGLDTPEFLAMNPHGRIPVLRLADGRALFETGAILRYLAGQAGSGTFWPADPLRRAEIDMWAEWAKYEVAEAFTCPVFWQAVRLKPAARDPARLDTARDRFETALARGVARIREGGYLCGPDLTLADIQFGHVLYRYFDAGIACRDIPGLRAYYDRLAARPAYRRRVMVSYEMLRDTVDSLEGT